MVLIAALAPAEKDLGTKVRVVYFHGAWVWAGKIAFGLAALAGLIGLLRELPQALLVATHDLRLVQELLPRTVVMDEGRVVADGPTAGILADAALLEAHGLELA